MKVAIETHLALTTLLAGFPAAAVALVLLWTGDVTSTIRWPLSILVVVFWLGFSWSAKERAARPLLTLANVISAVQEEDFSTRVAGSGTPGSLGELVREINALSTTLREQRLSALEANALLRSVMEEIAVAIFTFDQHDRLQLVNRAGARVLGQPIARLLGQTAAQVGLAGCLTDESPRTLQMSAPGASGRWELRRSVFRQRGLPHHLVVLSDLNRPLRDEERQARQRLIRVLGHELNNSLAPIKCTAESLGSMLRRDVRPADWEQDLERGLTIIGSRAGALTRFLKAYSDLARLPSPRFQSIDLHPLVRRVAELEPRLPVEVTAGPAVVVRDVTRTDRAGADQPHAECRGCVLGDERQCASWMVDRQHVPCGNLRGG